MKLGNFSVSLAVKDIGASLRVLREARLSADRWRPGKELVDPAERDQHDRALPGDVRQEYPDVQPWVGQNRRDLGEL